ncbi:Ankyrin-repeat protein [Orpheovirus IHUMI-LCC2]|uniref:Ankyrin-repeat protein n=1 Tax=Orpheovirus IHUMI-LCC2 TaxID=2023057 RepID=A0A2I2L495_9VIRU|nr:Ankyrin-repeat protein [Orpheovirus IHUMI-LCC2]SNW62353.1 Ankyrin-repeat protein [Orpheovirus IHUMI-LCC2]
MDNPITNDVFNYLINNFLSNAERTILRLLNISYRDKYNSYVSVKTLIENNNIDTVRWLIMEHSISCDIFCGLLQYGDINLLKLFVNNNNSILDKNLLFLENKRYPSFYNSAVKSGKIEILNWLASTCDRGSHDYGYFTAVKESFSLDIIKWCYIRASAHIRNTSLMNVNLPERCNRDIISWFMERRNY